MPEDARANSQETSVDVELRTTMRSPRELEREPHDRQGWRLGILGERTMIVTLGYALSTILEHADTQHSLNLIFMLLLE